MDKTKLNKALKRFEEYLLVDQGLARRTSQGYCRSLSISLKRMRKYNPHYEEIKTHMLWMREKEYSFSHINNTILAIEHYTRYKGNPVVLGRPKKPKRIIKDFLSESEISRMIAAANDIRKKCIVSLLAYSGIRNQELCSRHNFHSKKRKNGYNKVFHFLVYHDHCYHDDHYLHHGYYE